MFTGTYASVHGTFAHRTKLRAELPTLSEALAAAGYRTGFVSVKSLLFDLDADPHEQNNLAVSRADDVARWEAMLGEVFDLEAEVPEIEIDDQERRRLEALGYLK